MCVSGIPHPSTWDRCPSTTDPHTRWALVVQTRLPRGSQLICGSKHSDSDSEVGRCSQVLSGTLGRRKRLGDEGKLLLEMVGGSRRSRSSEVSIHTPV